MLVFRILADLVVAIHIAYVAFVIVGQLAILYGLARKRTWARNFYLRWLHLLTIAIVVVESWLSITCPLTDLENYLRAQAGQTAYAGDFVGHWIDQLLFYEAPPWVFMAAYTAFGALVLATFALAPPHRRQKREPGE